MGSENMIKEITTGTTIDIPVNVYPQGFITPENLVRLKLARPHLFDKFGELKPPKRWWEVWK